MKKEEIYEVKIATLLFTYNRSCHTEQVLSALKGNTTLPQKLFIFQDGLKREKDADEWNSVNNLIHNIDWCDNEVVVSEYNRGLADAIVFGIDYVFQEYDAIIVLEDDCVPHRGFMAFMIESLYKYRNRKEVFSASGYAYPVKIENNGTDAYFTRRISSWGWGTWKDRWAYYERDYRILGRIMNNPELAKQFHIWGEDLECYLRGNMYGICNSWAAFWALTVIEQKGYCLSPYKSLLKNIGLDGTGVHCGTNEIVQYIYDDDKADFLLPEIVEIPSGCETLFADYFSWTPPEKRMSLYNDFLLKWVDCATNSQFKLANRLKEKGIESCSIWGKGKICDLLLKELQGRVEILSIIESHPAEREYNGIPIVGVNNIPEETQLIIAVPIHDFYKVERMARKVTKCKMISLEEILEI